MSAHASGSAALGRGQLRPRLEGLIDDEYFWEPVNGCWTIHHRDEKRTAMQAGKGEMVYDFEFPEPDPPPITTIAWRLGHIGSSIFLVRAENHFGDGFPEPWWDHIEWPATARDALAFVDDGYARWMKGLASLDDDALARPSARPRVRGTRCRSPASSSTSIARSSTTGPRSPSCAISTARSNKG